MKITHLLSAIITSSSITSAWPWPPSLEDIKGLRGLENILYRRQEGGGNNNNNNNDITSVSATPAPSMASPISETPAPTSVASSPNTADSTASATSGTRASGATTGRITGTTAVTIATQGFPGGVNIINPNTQFGGSQYYAISAGVSSTVTWVWNYTSLAKPPSHVDVVATMLSSAGGVNPSPFTIAGNMSYEKTQTLTWDTGAYAETSLMPSGSYTLQIFDAAGGPTVAAQPGGLAPFAGLRFGVYQPAPYFVYEGVSCITCNAAGGKMEKLVWTMLVGSAGVAIGTMAWFTGLAGLW